MNTDQQEEMEKEFARKLKASKDELRGLRRKLKKLDRQLLDMHSLAYRAIGNPQTTWACLLCNQIQDLRKEMGFKDEPTDY